jgi:hypothetical protein
MFLSVFLLYKCSMLKVKVMKSKRGRGAGCAQNIAFENGGAFVTGAYSEIDWETREYLIARLARVWNMTCDIPDDVLDLIEASFHEIASKSKRAR